MDNNYLTQLTKDTSLFLAPVLPYLYKAGEEASKEAGKQIGGAVWEKAKALWKILNYKIEFKPQLKNSVEDIIENPEDDDALASFRLHLKKLLKSDDELTHQIGRAHV